MPSRGSRNRGDVKEREYRSIVRDIVAFYKSGDDYLVLGRKVGRTFDYNAIRSTRKKVKKYNLHNFIDVTTTPDGKVCLIRKEIQ